MTTKVVNLRRAYYDVYVGRAGKGENGYFGNPCKAKAGETREDSIEKFEVYFLERVQSDREFRNRVLRLRGKTLGCFCKPSACHADVIAAWVDAQFEDL